MDLIGLVKRFGPQTVVGASINLVAMTALLIGAIVSDRDLPVIPLIWLEIVFIGMLVLAVFLRRANLFQPERLPVPLDDLPEGRWSELPPLGEPSDEIFTRWHAVNATIAFLADEIRPWEAPAWAAAVIDAGIPLDPVDGELLNEFLTDWSSHSDSTISRQSVYVWQQRFAQD